MIRELGVGGVAVESGDHVCGFYYGEAERDDLLLGYLGAGLRDGDKCIGVVDSSEPEQVVGDLASYLRSKQLEIWGSAETYLRTGEFVPDDMMGFWDRHVRAASAKATSSSPGWSARCRGSRGSGSTASC